MHTVGHQQSKFIINNNNNNNIEKDNDIDYNHSISTAFSTQCISSSSNKIKL